MTFQSLTSTSDGLTFGLQPNGLLAYFSFSLMDSHMFLLSFFT